MEKKRKGGAEKLRVKTKKALATDAAKSRNMINMFAAAGAGGGGVDSGSGASRRVPLRRCRRTEKVRLPLPWWYRRGRRRLVVVIAGACAS